MLLVLIMNVMSLTVMSKNSVSPDGSCPPNMEAHYACTWQKGDVGRGDTATLELRYSTGVTVERVEVYVKSNKNSGAGVFTLEMNGETKATKSGSFKEWTGAYDNQNDLPVELWSQTLDEVREMTIRLAGTENSLHISKYVIAWTAPSSRTVTLMKGATAFGSVTEEEGGAGVLLPGMPDENEWHFVGWSASDFGETTERPDFIAPGTRFYPSSDCSLWATYRYEPDDETMYVSELTDGAYLYVNRSGNIALSGVPQGGRMTAASVDRNDSNQIYLIEMEGTQTAYITHVQTGTPIGYSGTNLAATASLWQIYHDGDQTLFWTTINGKKYILWLNIQDIHKDDDVFYTGLLQAEPSVSPMGLLPPKTESMIYTCHPEYAVGIEQVTAGEQHSDIYVLPLGNYELMIKNGQKELRQR